MVLGFVQRFEIKYIVELTDNAPDVLGGKNTVFHRIDHISPAGVVAPRLGQHSGQYGIVFHFLIPPLIKFRERRAHFLDLSKDNYTRLDLSKDNYTRRGAPTQTRGRPGGTGGQPVHCRIVAVGWPGPLAALVLFAHFPLGKVTAHPPPSSPDCVRGRPCSSAEKRKPPLINRDIFG